MLRGKFENALGQATRRGIQSSQQKEIVLP